MAEVLVVSARARTESRGGHYREDHPVREDDRWLAYTFVPQLPDGEPKLAHKDVTLDLYTLVERKH